MALRGRPPAGKEDWMEPVANLMVKEHMSFTSACMALNRKYETGQQEMIDKYSDAFQNVLDAIEFKFYSRLGDNPLLTKGVLAGALMTAIRRLGESDNWDSVHMPGKLLAEIMGWTETKPEQPVLANLTQADIDKIRAELKAKEASEQKTTVVVVDGGTLH